MPAMEQLLPYGIYHSRQLVSTCALGQVFTCSFWVYLNRSTTSLRISSERVPLKARFDRLRVSVQKEKSVTRLLFE